MIVLDANALVDFLLLSPGWEQIKDHIAGDVQLAAPDLIALEVSSTLSRLERAGTITSEESTSCLTHAGRLAIQRVPLLDLTADAWGMRHSLRTSDAYYVALARQLRWPLLTTDQKLARVATGISVITVS
ncbi:type II toxin-antitoxin system VapC family toxin [Knoellia sp. CPCC 206453]|uniref:type II toxin-antitoxin system VapC family toxin n=1 Tax=Knoellia pratensis TaxID=3404796 RepID=UPI00361B3B62